MGRLDPQPGRTGMAGSADQGSGDEDLFYAASLATVLAKRAFHALRLLEGSPLPAGRCIHRQQTSFSVQIQTERGLLQQHCLESQKLSPGARFG